MKIIERNLQEIGKSLLVTLPKSWTSALKLKKGSKIKMTMSDDGRLMIAPEFVEKKESKESTIVFDEHFVRRFFREYFEGNERITIVFNNSVSEKQRKDVYSFLKKFMNAQIVEESNNKISIKCFKIDELSIEECLKRMYFLSLNMFDELAAKNDKVKLNEMEDALTRFYYLLVMQIRRFLAEGKFTEENQISLLRAMDMRMVAEKIERIADVIKNSEYLDKTISAIILEIKDYYSKSFNSFIAENYEAAVPLMMENSRRRRKCAEMKTKILKQKTDAIQLLSYAGEIAMFVR